MGERVNAWRRRVMFEQLGAGYELWDLGRPQPAVHAKLTAYAMAMNRSYSDADVSYMLVEFLLDELLNAAGAVERSFCAMNEAAAAAQAYADESRSERSQRPEPLHGRHISNDHVSGAWHEFINMLMWTRCLEDRVERPGMGRDPQQGLWPALALGPLRDGVGSALGELRRGHTVEARLIVNYCIHGGQFPTPGTPTARIMPDNDQLRYEMPDPITQRVDHWYEFRFTSKRDAEVFAAELFHEITRFVDRVLDAFATAVPKRFRAIQL